VVNSGNAIADICALVAAIAALVTVALTFGALKVASRTLGEAVTARREAEADRAAVEADRAAAEADRRQARKDREYDRLTAKLDRDRQRLEHIFEILGLIDQLAYNDVTAIPPGTSWHAGRNLLAAALAALGVPLLNCRAILSANGPAAAMSAVAAARTEVGGALEQVTAIDEGRTVPSV
jgi:hypothetical protein